MDDYLALRSLAERYARGVDRRDAATFLSAFAPDGRLRVFQPTEATEPRTERRGHDELAAVTDLISRYDKTYHFIGNADYDVGDGTATGEVYCTAHHLTLDGEKGTDFVMYIRYLDEYRRDGDKWKIADRRVCVDWTEQREARNR